MKILYIHQYFKTPEAGGGLRSYYLAKYLVRQGHQVEMITAHNASSYKHSVEQGISVHYLPVKYDNSFGVGRRIYAFVKFLVLSMLWSTKLQGVDMCYVMTTPLTTGFVALFNKWFLSRPYFFEVGDLWPVVPIKMGIIRHPIAIWFTRVLEKSFYRGARGLIGLSPDISEHLGSLQPGKPIATIPNVADCEYFHITPKTGLLADAHGINAKYIISYIGALGKANQLSQLLNAAEAVADLSVHFFVVGAGAERGLLINLHKEKALENVTFIEHQNRSGVKRILDDSDAIYMSFMPVPILSSGSPNKLFDGLAAGKAVISNFGGWTRDLIVEQELGFVYLPEDVIEFKRNLTVLIEDKERQTKISKKSRKLAEDHFSLEVLGKQLNQFILDNCSSLLP